jgi:hypothetical protein
MVVFASFKGFENKPRGLIWGDVKDDMGESIDNIITKMNWVTDIIKLKFGNRYKIEMNSTKDEIIELQRINKTPKCDIFRRFEGEFHMIGGKHQGKKDSDLDKHELNQYCIWLVRNSYNEVTIKNALQILKKLHDE